MSLCRYIGWAESSRKHMPENTFLYGFLISAKDQAGLNRTVTSNQLIVDTSPPVTGQIVIDDLGQTAWVSSNIVRARLLSFEDFESGIDYFMANIGSSGFDDNVFEATKFYNDKLEFVMKEDVVDGHTYFLRVKVCWKYVSLCL